MGLDRQISFASKALYFMAIVAVVHWLTGGFLPFTWAFGSGFVDLGSVYVLAGHIVASHADALMTELGLEGLAIVLVGRCLEAFGVGLLFFFGYMTATRRFVAMPFAIVFLIVDSLVLFDKAAASGLYGVAIGIVATFLVVFHAIVAWYVWGAFWASTQHKTNAGIIRRMDLEHELKRRLSEPDGPPPPAATFDTRFRWTPPSGPAQPPQPQG